MKTLRFILGDQLSESISSLNSANPLTDIVMLCEVLEEATYVKHHKKKIAFLFSAMRHFADTLRDKKFVVHYVKLDDPENTGSFEGEVKRAIFKFNCQKIIVTEPGEWRVLENIHSWGKKLGLPVEVLSDTRFLSSRDEFKEWAKQKKQLRMEFFYRTMRTKYNILMETDGSPTGGQWNYDKENRSPPKKMLTFPDRIQHEKTQTTEEILRLVERKFHHHFGKLEPFNYAVTRSQALKEFDYFIEHYLIDFGTYQDAMLKDEPYLFHSRISTYLNSGLLLPLEVCRKVESAYLNNKIPLNSAEGYIRQILGWREYMRGIYWLLMPNYGKSNYLNAKIPLPHFYWDANTRMFCVAEVVRHTDQYAYSHHIQRLMITGNFALIAGLDVAEVQDWYLSVYSDAYEWVEMPNTLGMALFGDGGIIASKPYAASGNYIHKMSNFCGNCQYNPKETLGEKACPFNSLYWDFIARHQDKLKSNQRMRYVFSTWEKFGSEKQKKIREKANEILLKLKNQNENI